MFCIKCIVCIIKYGGDIFYQVHDMERIKKNHEKSFGMYSMGTPQKNSHVLDD